MMGGSFSFDGPAIFCYGHLGLSKTKCTPNNPKNLRIANNDQFSSGATDFGVRPSWTPLPLSVRARSGGFPSNVGVRGVRGLSPKCAIAFAPGRNCGKLSCPRSFATVCNRSQRCNIAMPLGKFSEPVGPSERFCDFVRRRPISLPLCSAHGTSKFPNPLGSSRILSAFWSFGFQGNECPTESAAQERLPEVSKRVQQESGKSV